MEKRPKGQLRNLNFELSKHVAIRETQMNDVSARSCKAAYSGTGRPQFKD